MFVFYQSGDNEKAYTALDRFVTAEFVELEWPIFESYLEDDRRLDELRDYQRLYRQDNYFHLAQVMLMDSSYFRHVTRAARN